MTEPYQEKSAGQRYCEALAHSARDTLYWLTIHTLEGWTFEEHRHWVQTGEAP